MTASLLFSSQLIDLVDWQRKEILCAACRCGSGTAQGRSSLCGRRTPWRARALWGNQSFACNVMAALLCDINKHSVCCSQVWERDAGKLRDSTGALIAVWQKDPMARTSTLEMDQFLPPARGAGADKQAVLYQARVPRRMARSGT